MLDMWSIIEYNEQHEEQSQQSLLLRSTSPR